MNTESSLRLNAVHFTQPLSPADYARLLRRVSPERQARIGRFRFWQDAHRSLFAELLARFMVYQALALPLDDIAFATTGKGKPFLPEVPGFHFNLSHSGDWILCATADSPVGVDVERIQPLAADAMAELFTLDERRVYEALPDLERQAFFYALWTIKESYVKAIGDGLQLDFRDLTVRLSTTQGAGIQVNDIDQNVRIMTRTMAPGYPAAVCAFQNERDGPPLQVSCWEAKDLVRQFK